ncbi:hypothetical protein LCGC14_1334550 [marine sediment metagenome]|uniref:Protein kinase domain-containing protein n=1 Tax=marine sediment metagenome TaxID=412755 RepID=A0A0F9MWE6_9ZZZZ
MTSIYDSWKTRYRIIEEITRNNAIPFSDKIEINQYIAEDLGLQQKVILKKINVKEDPRIQELAQYLWHYEISLNQRAINISKGKTLLKLIDGEYDNEDNCFILITEAGGSSLREILINKKENEDTELFNQLKNSNHSKKRIWEGILKLSEGLLAIHNAGLLHRNISLDTVYFNRESYREGEDHIFRLGDFNWSIYLYSISNLISDEITKDIIQNNLHFFRAPECLEIETFKSDIFSFGLVMAFLIFNLDMIEYEDTEFADRARLYNKIRDTINIQDGLKQEKEIILKAIELNHEDRFESIDEFVEKIRDFVNELKYLTITTPQLPIYFNIDRDSYFLNWIARKVDVNIQGIREHPNAFLKNEFSELSLYLTNNRDWPLWAIGKNAKYKFQIGRTNRKIAIVSLLSKNEERSFGLKNDICVCKVNKFYWQDFKEKSYSTWDRIFANALTQIRTVDEEPSDYELYKKRWLKALKLITKAEQNIEKRYIFEYELINDSINKENPKKSKRQITINIFNSAERTRFIQVLRNSQTQTVELLDSQDLKQRFRERRKWKFIEIVDEPDDFNIVVKWEEVRKNDSPSLNGYLRFWDLKPTLHLLKRKFMTIQNLEDKDYLVDAILNPAATHQYFLKDNKSDIVNFIFYTFPIFLLQGPPGTGKTWSAKELIRLTLERDPYKRILVSSKEHAALDDLLEKTYEMCLELKINPKPKIVRLISPHRERNYPPGSIAFRHFPKQMAIKMLENIEKWDPNLKKYDGILAEIENIIKYEGKAPSREWTDSIRESANLVFCTSTSNDLSKLESRPNFDLVIIEEAAKTYPSELFRPLQLGNKWVLIGDQNQLPPFKLNDIIELINEELDEIEEESKEEINFNERDFLEFRNLTLREVKVFQSMFERFKKVSPSYDSADERRSCNTLIGQHRLPSKISEMISTIFYDRAFRQEIHERDDLILEPSMMSNEQLIWINTKNERIFGEKRAGTDFYNIAEVNLIIRILKKIRINKKYIQFSLAILSPYNEQVNVLKTRLPNDLPNLKGINIKNSCYTVDSFQGQEADLVIISLVRSNNKEGIRSAWGFVPDPQRLNVMLSRARKVEIIVGDFKMCLNHRRNPIMEKFSKVAVFFQKEGKIISHDEV